jgi:hypothetical protein
MPGQAKITTAPCAQPAAIRKLGENPPDLLAVADRASKDCVHSRRFCESDRPISPSGLNDEFVQVGAVSVLFSDCSDSSAGVCLFASPALTCSSLSCAKYTIVSIRWKRTERDCSGKILKAASINGSTNSIPSAFHKHQQHSINCFSAWSPPAAKIGSISFLVSPSDRLSSAYTAASPNMAFSSFFFATRPLKIPPPFFCC